MLLSGCRLQLAEQRFGIINIIRLSSNFTFNFADVCFVFLRLTDEIIEAQVLNCIGIHLFLFLFRRQSICFDEIKLVYAKPSALSMCYQESSKNSMKKAPPLAGHTNLLL
jgi:hypothetical protein